MAKIRLAGGQYLAREDGTPGPWRSALKMRAERALVLSAELRARGIQAECIAASGGQSLEPQVEAAPVQHATVTWRGITPAQAPGGKWIFIFKDPASQSNQLITGSSPSEVIAKIQDLAGWNRDTLTLDRYVGHPVYSAFVASLPLDPGMTAEPGAPAFNQPAPPSATPGRVLRPSDLRNQPPPERPVETLRPAGNAVFEAWERAASVSALKDRYASDPTFHEWYDQYNLAAKS